MGNRLYSSIQIPTYFHFLPSLRFHRPVPANIYVPLFAYRNLARMTRITGDKRFWGRVEKREEGRKWEISWGHDRKWSSNANFYRKRNNDETSRSGESCMHCTI